MTLPRPSRVFFPPNLSFLESRLTTRFDSSSVPGEDPPSCSCGGEWGEHSLNFWVRAQAFDLPTFQPKASEWLLPTLNLSLAWSSWIVSLELVLL